MVTATVASLEELGEAWTRTQIRSELRERFDLWLDVLEETIEESAKEKPSTLEIPARVVFSKLQELTSLVTQAMVQKHPAREMYQETLHCPQCHRPLQAKLRSPGLRNA